MDDGDPLVLYRVWRTVKQMCYDRRYLVLQSDINMSLEDWRQNVWEPSPSRKDLSFAVQHNDDPTDQLFVFFAHEKDVSVTAIKAYFTKMQQGMMQRGILIVQNRVTPLAKASIKEMAPKYIMEQFFEGELKVNITRHVLVPQHQVLTDEEKRVLLETYKVSERQLPRMQVDDPISRYYGLSVGQVVRIIRRSETAGKYVTYRIVLA
eukprot:m.57411 g.57411  ORF g.57411 m.57411 type:complete len:207 (+) comp13459_c0_seq1:114-734(+)